MTPAKRFTCAHVIALAVALAACACSAHAKEDIEFVAEHLPEVAMDNRYATLPVWSGTQSSGQRGEQAWSFAAQVGWSDIRTGELNLSGPMLSFGVHRNLSSQWLLGAFAFYD